MVDILGPLRFLESHNFGKDFQLQKGGVDISGLSGFKMISVPELGRTGKEREGAYPIKRGEHGELSVFIVCSPGVRNLGLDQL